MTQDLKLRILKAQAEEAESKAGLALLENARGTFSIRPSHIYPCRTYYDELRGDWVCVFQEDETAIGTGNCPSAAMVAFDKMWSGDAGVDG